MPKSDQIWPKIGIFGHFGPDHAGLFGALLVGRLVVVARGLCLARHLFTLFFIIFFTASLNVGGSGSNALNLLSKCKLNVTHLTIFSCPDRTLKKDTNLSASIGI